MAETMYREDADDIFSRLEYIRKKMGRPNTSAKEMKTLQLREDNLRTKALIESLFKIFFSIVRVFT